MAEFPFTDEELATIEAGLDQIIDDYPHGSGPLNFQETELLIRKVRNFRGLAEPEPKKWTAKANKVTTPDGRTFNLRVDEEREAFLALMNEEES